MIAGFSRYARLTVALARYSLARELAFRGNFLVKMFVEVLWLSILLVFYRTVFSKTSVVAGWNEAEYLFFVGCYFTLEGLVETLFLENCNEFSDLVRNGDLDFILLQPIDEQFLVTCRKIDWSTAPNILMGIGVMLAALWQLGWAFDIVRLTAFIALFLCGLAMAYCFLLLLMSTAIWFVRNQSLFELWWLFTSLMRYPREVFDGSWAWTMGRFFTFVIPILLVISVPAKAMVKTIDDPWIIVYTVAATFLLLFLSRRFFLFSLRRYRSASS
jgi:ABC-2 type transport system permease protein